MALPAMRQFEMADIVPCSAVTAPGVTGAQRTPAPACGVAAVASATSAPRGGCR